MAWATVCTFSSVPSARLAAVQQRLSTATDGRDLLAQISASNDVQWLQQIAISADVAATLARSPLDRPRPRDLREATYLRLGNRHTRKPGDDYSRGKVDGEYGIDASVCERRRLANGSQSLP